MFGNKVRNLEISVNLCSHIHVDNGNSVRILYVCQYFTNSLEVTYRFSQLSPAFGCGLDKV